MEQDIGVYVTALQTALQEKRKVLHELLQLTQEQGRILVNKEMVADDFERLLQEKEKWLVKIQELDKGFQNLFDKIGSSLKENKQQYKQQILSMQEDIRAITDCGVQIEALEKKNRDSFAFFASGKRKEIRDFKMNTKSVASYHRNMAGQHQEWKTYFVAKEEGYIELEICYYSPIMEQ